mmetsp:Transcript_27258/g.60041  ORF Transcript_27258/g.60041 Transcript_27258/m.60041 type:complete len:297 (+) Transcript_27258:643-1533(+)
MVDVLALYGKTLPQGRQRRASVGFRQGVDLRGDLGIDFVDEIGIGAQQNGPGHHVVLCLGDEIGGHHSGVGRLVANDQDLRGPGQHVDPALAANDGLGGRDPHVARSANDVAGRNGFLAVDFQSKGHGGDRLGSPDPQKDVGTGHVRGREGDGVRFGAAQDDGLAPGGPGRYGRHQHAGRQRVSPAGGVAAGGSTGTDGVTGLPPRNVHLGVGDGVPLQLGKGLDAAVHVVENGSLGFVEAVVGPLALLRGHDQVPHGATRVDVPQALGDLQERGRIHSRASATSIGIGIGISAVL